MKLLISHKYLLLTTGVLFFILSMPSIATTKINGHVMGSLDGEFQVTHSGTVSYTLPIALPPGIGNVKPDIALSYASQASNHYLGLGWQLTGYSVISRCAKTIAQDDKVEGLTFTNSDKLCLDGQRLVLVKGVYWGNGSEYRTETESFSIIRYTTDAAGGYFTVEAKSGQISKYGSRTESNSRMYSRKYLDTANGPIKLWGIDELTDRLGVSKVFFDYIADYATGEQYPKNIYYSNECGNDPNICGHRIDFNFQDRNDKIKSFYKGIPTTISKRLEGITIFLNNIPHHEYKINYDYEPYPGGPRSRVRSIQECGKNDQTGAMDCTPPTRFDWQQAGNWTDASFTVGERVSSTHCRNTNNDNNECDLSTVGDNRTDNYYSVNYPDLNGDGLTDLCFRSDNGIRCHLSTGDPNQLWGERIVTSICANGNNSCGRYDYDKINYIDINSDGKTDIVYRDAANGITYYTFNGSGFNTYTTNVCKGTDCMYTVDKYKIWYPDLNGDAILDICYLTESGIKCRLSSAPSNTGLFTSAEISTSICANNNNNCNHTKASTVDTLVFADADGDGLSDIVFRGRYGVSIYRFNGTTFEDFDVSSEQRWGICHNNSTPGEPSGNCNVDDNAAYVKFPDINGDGIVDVCYRADWNHGIRCRLGTGKQNQHWHNDIISAPPCNNQDSSYTYGRCNDENNWSTIQFVDFNSDGAQDLVYRGDGGIRVWVYNGSGFTMLNFDVTDICADGSGQYGICNDEDNRATIQFADFNGDGKLDLAYRGDEGVQVWVQSNYKPSLISKITNGFGASTSIVYRPMTDPAVYTKPTFCQPYPIQCPGATAWLVSSIQNDNGIGGTSELIYNYKYLRVHLRGRGSLGFDEFISYDPLTQTKTVNTFVNTFAFNFYPGDTVYADDTFPRAGKVYKSYVYSEVGSTPVQLKYSINAVTTKKVRYNSNGEVDNDLGSIKTYFPYTLYTTEYTYELNGKKYNYEHTSFSRDDFGNVLSTRVDTKTYDSDDVEIGSHVAINSNVYFDSGNSVDDAEEQRFGRLYETLVENQLSEDGFTTQTRKTRYKYYESGWKKHMLFQTIEEPDDEKLKLVTEYDYDIYGNQNKVTVSGSTVLANDKDYGVTTRTSTQNYNYAGLKNADLNNAVIELQSINAAGLTENKQLDARHGGVRFQEGPNQNPTRSEYDGFGRVVREKIQGISGVVGESETITEYHWCEGDSQANCPNFAVYYVKKFSRLTSGQYLSPPAIVYYDRLGREVRTESLNYNKNTVFKDIQYDEFGRVWRESRNYFKGTIPNYWTTYTYDDLGRVTRMVNPDGTIVTTEYDGNETSVIRERRGENGYTAIRQYQQKSVTGKVRWVIDALGNDENQTLYHYTPFGELAQTTDAHGNVMSMNYDLRGRKTSMNDPDMGFWEYRHDALGNLRWQKDNKGQIVEMTYDVLNRMVERRDMASGETARWEYFDNTAPKGSRGNLKQVTNSIDNYIEDYAYDSFGRPTVKTTAFNDSSGRMVDTVTTVYDTLYPRVDHVVYPASNDRGTTRTLKKQNVYEPTYSFLKAVKELGTNNNFWEAVFANADGKITLEITNGSITTARSFDPATGLLKTISAGTSASNANIQNMEYVWDSLGNLEKRIDHNRKLTGSGPAGVTERFVYDALNRLTSVEENGITQQHLQYDRIGNITFNSNVGYYEYGVNGAGPHAVTETRSVMTVNSDSPGNAKPDNYINSLDSFVTAEQLVNIRQAPGNADCQSNSNVDLHDVACIAAKIAGTASNSIPKSYKYDGNGNLLTVKSHTSTTLRAVTWTTYNKPQTITANGTILIFDYGPDRARYRQVIDDGTNTTRMHYVGGVYERIVQSNKTLYRNYITAGNRVIAVREYSTDAAPKDSFLHGDHMGSTTVVTNAANAVVERFSYDPFGKRRAAIWNDGFQNADSIVTAFTVSGITTSRWFTGHEQLQSVGLIHMNGRVYDPEIGRFMSADPHVQFTHDSQSFNRYSYVLNNPLSFTDPSGYFGEKFFNKFNNFMNKYGYTIIGIAIVAIAPAGAEIFAGFFSGLVSSRGDLRAAAIGALAAWGYGYAGDVTAASGFTGTAQLGVKMLTHGIVGGVSARMSGGNFGRGFAASALSAGASKGMESAGMFSEATRELGGRLQNAFMAALAGGTISEMTGGKFRNGALTGAMQRIFNGLSGTAEDWDLDGLGEGLGAGARIGGRIVGGVVVGAAIPSELADGNSDPNGVYFHYTDEQGLSGIVKDGVIRADTKGRVFVTQDALNPAQAQNLFAGNPDYAGRGSHFISFTVNEGVIFEKGTMPNELIHRGSMRFNRQIKEIIYAGENFYK